MDTGKEIIYCRDVEAWHSLPREAVDAPFLEAFKARFEWGLKQPGPRKVSLPMARDWHWIVFKVPFQPKPFSNSVKQLSLRF